MATKAKRKTAKKTTSKDELRAAFSEQLGTLHDKNVRLWHENERLKRELDNLKEAYVLVSNDNSDLRAKLANEKASSRSWVLRKLGLR